MPAARRHPLPAASTRRSMRVSILDGLFAVQYITLAGGTLLTAFLLRLGASAFQIGLVAALPLLGGLLQPAGAELIRRRGGWRKPVCLTAALTEALLWFASLAATLLLPPRSAVVAVIGVLALQQAVNAFVGISWTSWISDLVPPSLRGRFFGRRNFIINGFGALTAVGAGQLIKLAGPDSIEVFLGLISTGIVLRLISIYFLSRQPEPSPARSTAEGLLRQFAGPLQHDGFRRFLAYGMAWGFAVQIVSPFFNVYMIREAHVGVDTVMFFAALGTASNLVGQRFWGPLCDRYGDHQVLRSTGLAVALQPAWWLFAQPEGAGFYLMGMLSITGGFAWSGNLLATGNLMMRLAPETGKTSFFALQAALGGAFGALGPLVGGVLASTFAGGVALLPGPLFEGMKSLFLISVVIRLGAWGMLHRVPEPVQRPPLRAVYLLRDAVRTLNPAQGFSPLLHVFSIAARTRQVRRRPSAQRRTTRQIKKGSART